MGELSKSIPAPVETDAYLSGREAGRMLLSPSLNPHPIFSADHIRWEYGRIAAMWRGPAAYPLIPAIRPCAECACGGRGHCLDIA